MQVQNLIFQQSIIKTLQKEERYKDVDIMELRPLAIKILQDKIKRNKDNTRLKRVIEKTTGFPTGPKFQSGGPQYGMPPTSTMPVAPNKTWLNLVDQIGNGETINNEEYMSVANIL